MSNLSEAEWDELDALFATLDPDAAHRLLQQASDETGRIPTPADDGVSGWIDRTLSLTDEQRMTTRVGKSDDLWRRCLELLRAKSAGA